VPRQALHCWLHYSRHVFIRAGQTRFGLSCTLSRVLAYGATYFIYFNFHHMGTGNLIPGIAELPAGL
jgi:hypothetical protein